MDLLPKFMNLSLYIVKGQSYKLDIDITFGFSNFTFQVVTQITSALSNNLPHNNEIVEWLRQQLAWRL